MKTPKLKNFLKPTLFKIVLFIGFIALSLVMIEFMHEGIARCFDRAGIDCGFNIIQGLLELIFAIPFLFMIEETSSFFLAYLLVFINSYIFSCLIAYLFNKFFSKQKQIKTIFTICIFFISAGYLFFKIYEKIDRKINSVPQVREQQFVQKTEFKIADLQCTEEILPYDLVDELEFTDDNRLAYTAMSKDDSFIVFDQKEIAYDFKGVHLLSAGGINQISFFGSKNNKTYFGTYEYQTDSDKNKELKSLRGVIEFKQNNSDTIIVHKNADLDARFQNVNTNPEFSSDGTFFTFFKAKDPWNPNIILTICHAIN